MTSLCAECSHRLPTESITGRAARWLRRCSIVVTALATLASAPSTGASEPAGAGQWLVDRARTYGLLVDGLPSAGQAGLMLVWFEAAARISPALADAYLGQHDLLLLLGRGDEALEVLGQYCARNPANYNRRLELIAAQFTQGQTIEERIEFCDSQLADETLPGPVASEVHRLLARAYQATGDLDLARQQAAAAVEAYPFNFAARRLWLDLLGEEAPPELQAEYLLASIAALPTQWETMRSLAQLLDTLSMHAEAATWYGRAFQTYAQANPDGTLPAAAYLDAARSAHDGGQHDLALSLCRKALERDPTSYEAAELLIDLARRTGRDDLAARELTKLRVRLAATEQEVRLRRDAKGAGRIAWFHVHTEVDQDKAIEFAELAAGANPDNRLIQRVYGLALVNSQRWAKAQQVLGPPATGPSPDQYAAWGLAQALLGMGDREAAIEMLRDGEQIRRSGPAYELIAGSLRELGAAPLPPPDHGKVSAALAGFEPEVLRFREQPAKYLQLTAQLINAKPRFGEPWRCRLGLINRGPFAIPLGPDALVEGQLLVSAQVQGPGFEPAVGYLPIPMAMQPVLLPGQRLEVVHSLDIGPLAEAKLALAQRELEVTFTIILDPVEEPAGQWLPKLGSDMMASVRLTRRSMDYTRAGVGALNNELRSRQPARRVRAYRCVAGLLAERLRAMRQRLDYQPARVDKDGLTDVLLSGLTDPDPWVQAATLDVLPLLPWKDEYAQAVAPLIVEGHWLVRLAAIELLASRQGSVFSPVAGRLADEDPDPLVRKLALLHLQRLQTPQLSPRGTARPRR